MVARAAVEAILIAFSLGIFVIYHFWLFFVIGHGWCRRRPVQRGGAGAYFLAGKVARSIWAEACSADEKEAILAVQTARNAMTPCTFLAALSGTLAAIGVPILLDSSKTDQIAALANADPIVRHLTGPPLVQPVTNLALALGALFAAFVCFAQSARLYTHVGFYVRAVPSRFNVNHAITAAHAKAAAVHAGVTFSLGLRLFYLFIPLVLWSVGVTALLISSVVLVLMLAYLDRMEMVPEQELLALAAADRHLSVHDGVAAAPAQSSGNEQRQGTPSDPLLPPAGRSAGAVAAAGSVDGSDGGPAGGDIEQGRRKDAMLQMAGLNDS